MDTTTLILLLAAGYILVSRNTAATTAPVSNALNAVLSTAPNAAGVCADVGQCGPNATYGPTAWTPAPDLCRRDAGGFCIGPINMLTVATQRATACGCAAKQIPG